MQSKAATVDEYMAELPPERRAALEVLRDVFRRNIDTSAVEVMGYGLPGFAIPHGVYPPGYHCDPSQPLPLAGWASQKQYMSLYLFCLYCDEKLKAWFTDAWRKAGKKLDMGKGCIRFRSIDDVPLDVVAECLRRMTVKRTIELYEREFKGARERRAATKPARKSSRKAASTKARPGSSAKAVARKKVGKKQVARKKPSTRAAARR
ncbi:MAG: hypothetical protein GIKADHBN_01520 [Phycisphaerales bacterium]|nr:hypothetical protein [Phycisphaerales bacterium]